MKREISDLDATSGNRSDNPDTGRSYHRSGLLTPGAVSFYWKDSSPQAPLFIRYEAIAPVSPGVVRRFPFFAALWPRRGVSFRFRELANGEIAKMIIKASGRSALILATGLWICLAGPSQAATDDTAANSTSSGTAPLALNKYAKPGARHLKKIAHRKSSRLAQKSSADSKAVAASTTTSDDSGNSASAVPSTLSSSIANANAKMASADTPDSNARAMTARASNILQATSNDTANIQASSNGPADIQVVSADQLNDIDRALHDSSQNSESQNSQRQGPLAIASAEPSAAVASNDRNSLDETSLIGKIFIGFGALLTLASAARMFMA